MQLLRTDFGVLHIWASELASRRKTLVFINSLGTDFRIWDDVVRALGDRFNIVLHDKAGHGLSTERAHNPKISDYADDLNTILLYLKLTKVVVCGISVGGLVAQSLYQKRPDVVEGLILSNTGLKIGTIDSWNARIAAIEAGGIASIAEPILERWFAPEFRERKQGDYALYRNMLVRTSSAGYLACCEAIRNADFSTDAKKIATPVLCIGGELDTSTPAAMVESMASQIPAGKFELIKGAAHLPCIETPEIFSKMISTFVETI